MTGDPGRGAVARRHRGLAPAGACGFTLIELLVVFVIVGLLLSIALPRYQSSVLRSKEAVLRQNLTTTREAIDRHYADRARYPDSLEELVRDGYLRTLPNDPLVESTTAWVIVAPRDLGTPGRVYDLRSTAPGNARDGSRYEDW